MVSVLLATALGVALSAPAKAKPKAKGFTYTASPAQLWAASVRDTVWVSWFTGSLGSSADGWKLEGKADKGWVPVYPELKPVFLTSDTAEIARPLCPSDFVAQARRSVYDPRGGLHRMSRPMTNASLRKELAKIPAEMRGLSEAMIASGTAQDAHVAVALGTGAMVPDPTGKWKAFRVVPVRKGKTLEAKVIVPDLRIDSVRNVRMVPDRATMGINLGTSSDGQGKATLESRTPDPTQYTLYYQAWSSASSLPGVEMSFWVKDSAETWERLRHMGTSTPFTGRDTQLHLDSAEIAKVRASKAVGFGYAVLSRLDLVRIEVPASEVKWESH
jgi:hypothetical protein